MFLIGTSSCIAGMGSDQLSLFNQHCTRGSIRGATSTPCLTGAVWALHPPEMAPVESKPIGGTHRCLVNQISARTPHQVLPPSSPTSSLFPNGWCPRSSFFCCVHQS